MAKAAESEVFIMEIKALVPADSLWQELMAYAASCSWKAGPFLARDMENGHFTEWEHVFAALEDRTGSASGEYEIAGYCTLARRDCIPDIPYTPYIGYMFVGEKFRGRRLSGQLIQAALAYAGELGFPRVYLVSGERGLYEKYGFRKIDEKKDAWGNDEQIFMIEL